MLRFYSIEYQLCIFIHITVNVTIIKNKMSKYIKFSTSASNATWSIGVGNQTHVISNPFTGGDLWRPSTNIVNNNTQPADNSLCNPANPFKSTQLPVNNGKLC